MRIFKLAIIHIKTSLGKVLLLFLKASNSRIRFGKGVRVDFKTKLHIWCGYLELGDNVVLRSNPRGYHAGMPFSTTLLIDVNDAFIKIGNNSRLNGVYVHSQKGITIGKNVVIASGVSIIDSDGHQILSFDRTFGRDIPKEIIIGDNVWIGLNSIILKGSSIGNNSVVGAGSIVRGEFPSNSIIVGNPAKVVEEIRF